MGDVQIVTLLLDDGRTVVYYGPPQISGHETVKHIAVDIIRNVPGEWTWWHIDKSSYG